MEQIDLERILDIQISRLIDLGYPKLAGIDGEALRRSAHALLLALEPLKFPDVDHEKGTLPFVLIVKTPHTSAELRMQLVEKDGKHGTTVLRPLNSEDFRTIDSVSVPDSPMYILADIDRGRKTLNVPPEQAFASITAGGRSPLTIDEGIAVITQYPEFLMKNNCFSLLASRTGTDKRVPAIWINAKKEPNLGWCWNGNPHTWLGSASCATRIG